MNIIIRVKKDYLSARHACRSVPSTRRACRSIPITKVQVSKIHKVLKTSAEAANPHQHRTALADLHQRGTMLAIPCQRRSAATDPHPCGLARAVPCLVRDNSTCHAPRVPKTVGESLSRRGGAVELQSQEPRISTRASKIPVNFVIKKKSFEGSEARSPRINLGTNKDPTQTAIGDKLRNFVIEDRESSNTPQLHRGSFMSINQGLNVVLESKASLGGMKDPHVEVFEDSWNLFILEGVFFLESRIWSPSLLLRLLL
uniref:Uncharacterized protein n=1 Tax=Asparagus officinalis TaxID=4686 RepID=Q2XNW2_ASPOF|nr:hypothetical protein 12.t00019 [Asparagus officinalis]